jgi:hypothetical protein
MFALLKSSITNLEWCRNLPFLGQQKAIYPSMSATPRSDRKPVVVTPLAHDVG